MATKVLAPKLGEGVNELTIVRWLKQEGEPVQELESLLEVETDKVVTEIPSPASGTLLKRLVAENGVAGVGSVIAWIGQPGENIPSDSGGGIQRLLTLDAAAAQTRSRETSDSGAASAAESNVSRRWEAAETDARSREISESRSHNGGSKPAQEAGNTLGFISPVVAKIAGENRVDLKQVKGTGLGGRITKKDILNYLERGRPAPVAEAASAETAPGDRLVPVSVIRKSIASRMLLSVQTSPHVLTAMEADLSRVMAHLAANKEAFARDGLKLTYTAYFISAIVSGLRAYPLANSSWSEAGLVIHGAYNIGMATSLGEEGLIVPVIKDADRLSLAGIARAVNDLSARARAKKLQPEEVKGGTFTLTNHGISGSLFAMPIINQPQCGILGTGAIQKRPVVVTDADGNDAIAIRPMVYLSFVFDHRILDGALADMFLSQVVESLQTWK